MENKFYLFGLLLGYPKCCIEAFCKGEQFTIKGKPSYNGFIPCAKCATKSLAKLEAEVGRSFEDYPIPFDTFYRYPSKPNGIKKYKAVGQREFFEDCWEKAMLGILDK